MQMKTWHAGADDRREHSLGVFASLKSLGESRRDDSDARCFLLPQPVALCGVAARFGTAVRVDCQECLHLSAIGEDVRTSPPGCSPRPAWWKDRSQPAYWAARIGTAVRSTAHQEVTAGAASVHSLVGRPRLPWTGEMAVNTRRQATARDLNTRFQIQNTGTAGGIRTPDPLFRSQVPASPYRRAKQHSESTVGWAAASVSTALCQISFPLLSKLVSESRGKMAAVTVWPTTPSSHASRRRDQCLASFNRARQVGSAHARRLPRHSEECWDERPLLRSSHCG